MRLIDADKLREKDMNGDVVDIFDVLEAPTVEAIPIEWIRRYASSKSANDGMDCYWSFWEEDVLKMIDEWEKENEV